MKTKLFLLVLMFAGQVHADGNQLLSNCENTSAPFQGYCLGYARGVADVRMNEIFIAYYGIKDACIPDGATNKQLADIVTAYLVKHPSTRDLNSSILATRAFAEAFPCPETEEKK